MVVRTKPNTKTLPVLLNLTKRTLNPQNDNDNVCLNCKLTKYTKNVKNKL